MTTTTSTDYKDLNEFLSKHNAKNDKNSESTHTRIPDKDMNIYAGSYVIPKEALQTFYKLYVDNIFVKNRKEYLTEKQLDNGQSPIAVDFDFRYNYDVDKRQHTNEHIVDMILLYLEELKNYFVFDEDKPFDIFIFEKPNVNRLADKSLTKDGIHMIIGIQMDHTMQMMLREKMIEKLPDVWELPFINDWDKILDDGISKGSTNWQMYGSRKPGNEAYELTSHYNITYDNSDGEFMMNELKVSNFDIKNDYYKLSVQNTENPKFEMNEKIMTEYNKRLANKGNKIKRPNSKTKMNLLVESDDELASSQLSINDITNRELLVRAIDNLMSSLSPMEYYIKETHEYTQILPEKYYEPGSHGLNRQVAFALKHTDERLFLSWVMLRSKASDFDYKTIPSLYHDWKKYFNTSKEGVTRRSIMYWAKQDAFDDYLKVKDNTIGFYIEESIGNNNEYDIAQVLFQMYKDKYVCVSYDKKGGWYIFKNHRWEPDKGLSLRKAISEQMYTIFCKKREEVMAEYTSTTNSEEYKEHLNKKTTNLMQIMNKLRKTNDKNNIMREAAELFFDKDFITQMDTNKYLLCFNNGVVDFKTKTFRDGYPQDYITKTTGINYAPLNLLDTEIKKINDDIFEFMRKLFPNEEQNKYMWDHLASCLIGTNKNQTFNIYHGSGSNGKSMLADLMSHTLGQYKGVVPVNLITDKRVSIGGTSDEIMKLKGIRYAVAQELTKGMKLNEGIMKELTGGDPIQARGLYCESETFYPQFKLVMCTNNLFDIESNDDGTWRRIRRVVYRAKFVDENDIDNYSDLPYVFPKDKSLEEKLPLFAPVFAALLVKRAFETNGLVEDCEVVLADSSNYRKGQDHIAAFVNEMICKTGNVKDKIKKNEIVNQFNLWFQNEQGSRRKPKGEELYEYLNKKFGPCTSSGWQGVKIVYPDACDDINEI
jgi:P4 family phage/plasmid primase-like protien